MVGGYCGEGVLRHIAQTECVMRICIGFEGELVCGIAQAFLF